MIDKNRQTGRSSRQLKEAYEKYGKFIYVINGFHVDRYYRVLLEELNIPQEAVKFTSVYLVNSDSLMGMDLPIIVDHNADRYLSNHALKYLQAINSRSLNK